LRSVKRCLKITGRIRRGNGRKRRKNMGLEIIKKVHLRNILASSIGRMVIIVMRMKMIMITMIFL